LYILDRNKEEHMRGLALEGGGARGAYHIGVVKALLENGYDFDGFVGTSIGAINAAVLAQGDFEKALDIWANISMEQLFDVDDKFLLELGKLELNMKLPSNIKRSLKKIIDGRGVDTSRMKAFIEKHIDEEKIRRSGKDFGLVTVSINERIPYEIFLEDIPEGKLINFIMASASFPGFKPEVIDEKLFLDGGLYNNCPINLLTDKGYDEVIAIRTGAPGIFRKVEHVKGIKLISPHEHLGNMLLFTKERSAALIKLGYLDGLRFVKNLCGRMYYFHPTDINSVYIQLISMNDNDILEVGRMLDIHEMPGKRMLFEHIIPQLGSHLKLEKDFDYADFVIALLEDAAMKRNIDRYQTYDYRQFYLILKASPSLTNNKNASLLDLVPGTGFLQRKAMAVEKLTEFLLNSYDN